ELDPLPEFAAPPAPQSPPSGKAPARPAEQVVKDDAFNLPEEDEIPSFEPEEIEDSTAIAELDFTTPTDEALEEELGIAPRLADLGAEAPPLPKLREPTADELP